MRRSVLLRVNTTGPGGELRSCTAPEGFEGLELNLADPRTLVADREAGRECPAVTGLTGEGNALAVACRSRSVVEAAGELAVLMDAFRDRAICLNLMLPGPHAGSEPSSPGRYQDGLDFANDLLRKLRFRAESAGIAIGLEAAAGGSLNSPIELRELLDGVHSWTAGACLDVARIAAIGSPIDWIGALAGRIRAVRVPAVAARPDQAQAFGPLPTVEELTAALDEIGFDGALIIDPGDRDDSAATVIEVALLRGRGRFGTHDPESAAAICERSPSRIE